MHHGLIDHLDDLFISTLPETPFAKPFAYPFSKGGSSTLPAQQRAALAPRSPRYVSDVAKGHAEGFAKDLAKGTVP